MVSISGMHLVGKLVGFILLPRRRHFIVFWVFFNRASTSAHSLRQASCSGSGSVASGSRLRMTPCFYGSTMICTQKNLPVDKEGPPARIME
jgi:hypothetical protein